MILNRQTIKFLSTIIILALLSGCRTTRTQSSLKIIPARSDNSVESLRITIDGETWHPTHFWFEDNSFHYLYAYLWQENGDNKSGQLVIRFYLSDPKTYRLLKQEGPHYVSAENERYIYHEGGRFEIVEYDRRNRIYSGKYEFPLENSDGDIKQFKLDIKVKYSSELGATIRILDGISSNK